MNPFYAIDSTRVSLREYWWGSRSPLVLLAWILKWLHVRIPTSTDDPNVHEIRPFEAALLPPAIHGRFEALDAELQRLGFVDPMFHWIPDPLTRTNIYWSTYRHTDGQHVARIHHRVWDQANPSERGLFVQFFTAFTDGSFLVSSAGKADMDAPASLRINRWVGAKPSHLWQSHLQRLSETGSRSIEPVATGEDLRILMDRFHVSLRDFHKKRGVFRPRTPAEEAQAVATEAARKVTAEGGSREAEVLAEMEKILHAKPGWKSAIWILVVSAIAFAAADRFDGPGRGASGGWVSTVLLLLVLLIHESGHWVAMKISGHKNIRMFFIPFFGAAVTGRHWNVEGWKKAIVALAGPIPGIVIGTLLAFASLAIPNEALHTAAILFLAINGFNLLPFLPLDGGQHLDAILFSRNRWLSVAFKIVGIACLLGVGMRGSPMFGVLAIVLASSLPLQFRLARIKDSLKSQMTESVATAGDSLPMPLAETVVGAVRKDLPPSTAPKTIAELSLSLLETLHARPPGVLLTLFFIGLHLGAVLICLLGLSVVGLSKSGAWGSVLRDAESPTPPVSCPLNPEESIGRPAAEGEVITLAAEFSDPTTASNALQRAISTLPTKPRECA